MKQPKFADKEQLETMIDDFKKSQEKVLYSLRFRILTDLIRFYLTSIELGGKLEHIGKWKNQHLDEFTLSIKRICPKSSKKIISKFNVIFQEKSLKIDDISLFYPLDNKTESLIHHYLCLKNISFSQEGLSQAKKNRIKEKLKYIL